MELTNNGARRDPDTRKALKDQQRARLAAKKKVAEGKMTTEEYSALFAKQPEQVARAAANEAAAAQRRAQKRASVTGAIANARGAVEVFAGGSTEDSD